MLPLFRKYGEVVDHLVKEEYAFIEFASVIQADRALKELDGYNVRGGKLSV